jgi:hypothetical protein
VNASRLIAAALVVIVLIGGALRLYHVRDPILDHPGWRQGDQAAIARNFAQLQNDIFYPQVDYDGPPPNYIELELQIVPFTAAQLYKAFGVHVVFGRLIVVMFSLGTILLVYWFGVELASRRAGVAAALLLAIAPGAIYYGRTFTPDSVMVFFSTGVLLFWWRWCMRRMPVDLIAAIAFGALAWLAKPPALLVLAPILGVLVARRGWRAFIDWSLYAFLAATLLPFVLYFNHVRAIAEWHWFSGITQKHVLPALWTALSSPGAFSDALQNAMALLGMLAHTVLGPVVLTLMLGGALVLPESESKRERTWLFATWAAALCAYAFVVVNVERVDYYLLPWLPLAVLVAGVAIDGVWQRVVQRTVPAGAWIALAAAVFIAGYISMLELAPYYVWNPRVYASATQLDRDLAPGSIIVMGHYGPDVLYLINRKGWEEDPVLWTVHDMKSAIAKGARYFVAVEPARLRANPELYSFLERFPKVATTSGWPVYDLGKM